LTAVCPDRRSIVNGQIPSWERSHASCDGHEPRIEANETSCCIDQLFAGSSETRLGDGMVLLLKLENDRVPGLSRNTTGSESQIARASTHYNDMDTPSQRNWSGTWRIRVRRVRCRPNRVLNGDSICYDHRGIRRRDRSSSIVGCPCFCTGSWGGRSARNSSTADKAGSDSKSSRLEISERVWTAVSSAVNGVHHSMSTMTICSIRSLFAINPDRICVVNSNSKSRRTTRLVRHDGHESGINPSGLGPAGARKAGLGDRMVFRVEKVDHLITRLGGYSFGIEYKFPIRTPNSDVYHLLRKSRAHQREPDCKT